MPILLFHTMHAPLASNITITPIGLVEYDDDLDRDNVDYQGDLTSVDYNALARPGAVGAAIGHLLFLQSFLEPEKVTEHADNVTVPDHGPQTANLADDEVIDLGAHVINQHWSIHLLCIVSTLYMTFALTSKPQSYTSSSFKDLTRL